LAKQRQYFRADTDGNLSPASATEWFFLASVPLGNRREDGADDQDYVGVAAAWTWPDAFEGVTVADLRAVQAAIGAGRWRENPQAKDWAGNAVATVLKLNTANKTDKAKIIALLKTWIENGMLVVVDGEDAQRIKRKFIEAGEPAND
jgi:hypothetical protein